MSTYHATLRVGEKSYPVSTKAGSQDEALQRIAHVAASSFPTQKSIRIEFVEPEKAESEARNFLKHLFGIK